VKLSDVLRTKCSVEVSQMHSVNTMQIRAQERNFHAKIGGFWGIEKFERKVYWLIDVAL